MFCAKCGFKLEDDMLFCPECGAKQEEATIPPLTPVPAEQPIQTPTLMRTDLTEQMAGQVSPIPKKKKGPFIVGAVLLTVVITAGVFFGFRGKDDTLPVVYLKDNEIYSFNGGKSGVMDDSAFAYMQDTNLPLAGSITVSSDNKYMYYYKNVTENVGDLYCRKVDGRADALKLDSDVLNYDISSDGRVFYTKDGNAPNLYVHNLVDKEKIASDLYSPSSFWLSEDGKKIMWKNDDSKLYLQDTALKTEKEKIDSDVFYVRGYTKDFREVMYCKDNGDGTTDLYLKRAGQNKEKIASDVEYAYVACGTAKNSIQAFYVKKNDEADLTYKELVEDEYAQSDSEMVEPNIEDYQMKETVPSFWGDRERIVTDDKYYEQLEQYEEKLLRDEVRKEISTVCMEGKEIFYFNSEKQKQGQSMYTYTGVLDFWVATDENGKLVMRLLSLDKDILTDKIAMKQLMDMNDTEQMKDEINKKMKNLMDIHILDENGIFKLNMSSAETFENIYDSWCGVNFNSNELYFCFLDAEKEEYNLYSTSLNERNGKLLKVASSLEGSIYTYMTCEDGIYFTCGYDEDENQLYLNDQQIDSDVDVIYGVAGNCFYLKDFDTTDREGTLCRFDGVNVQEITGDVSYVVINLNDNLEVLTDYNYNKQRGDFYVYAADQLTPVDTDVAGIYNVYQRR